jgi:hypothetical protein
MDLTKEDHMRRFLAACAIGSSAFIFAAGALLGAI